MSEDVFFIYLQSLYKIIIVKVFVASSSASPNKNLNKRTHQLNKNKKKTFFIWYSSMYSTYILCLIG